MARSKKKSSKKKTKKKARRGQSESLWDRLPIDGESARRAAIAAGWLLLVTGLVVAWMMGVPRLTAYASAQAAQDPVEVRFVEAPAWIRDDLRTHLILTAQEQLANADAMSWTGPEAVRSALEQTGWFESVDEVRRTSANMIEIRAEWVKPYALIRFRKRDHLVDHEGTLLPWSVETGQSRRFVCITAPRFDPPARPGEPWPGADVTAALRLLQEINAQPWNHQVSEIDLGSYFVDNALVIVTDRRARIIWGRSPDDRSAIEVPLETKLGYLMKNFSQLRHIDGGWGRLDIRGDVADASGTAPGRSRDSGGSG